MPERETVCRRVAEVVLGGPWLWDGLTGTIEPGQGVTDEEYEAKVEQVRDLYDRAARIINWQRILESAAGRHRALGHRDVLNASWGVPTNICAECIEAAVLDRERFGADWREGGDTGAR